MREEFHIFGLYPVLNLLCYKLYTTLSGDFFRIYVNHQTLSWHIVFFFFFYQDEPPFLPESFDRVLLDAPCSALGQRPQFILNQKLSDLKSYSHYQRMLLKQV